MSEVFKVAHITTIDTSLRFLLLNQLMSINRAGYEVVGISAGGEHLDAIKAAGIRHIEVPMTRRVTPFRDLISLLTLYKVMKKEQFSIVHTHTPKPGLLGQVAARMANVPVIINTLHGFYFHDRMPRFVRRFYMSLEKIAGRYSDVILSQNSEDIRTAIREGICRPEQIRLLGNGIDIRRFDPERMDTRVIAKNRMELGLKADRPVVGFVGRLVAEKGIRELLSAAKLILEKHPGTQFLFVGPSDQEKFDSITPESVQEFEVSSACIFTGVRYDMPEMYSLMDVFCLPSHREGFPRAPMEASAMKVPCVVTDIRGCRETVENGQNGYLVRVGDVESLADTISRLLSNTEMMRRMGEVGRAMAMSRFDEEIVFNRVKVEYRRLLSKKGLLQRSSLSFAEHDAGTLL